jgi:ribosomal-protein-alanine N-acetyltransferase
MTIRKFEPDDLQIVNHLVTTLFRERYDPDIYYDFSESWPDGCLVAEMGAEVIGFIMAAQVRPTVARLLILGVYQEYRGKGVGSALLRALINRSIIRGCKSITLEVRVKNEMAQRFYSKHGFTSVGMIPEFYSNGDSAYLMKKIIY